MELTAFLQAGTNSCKLKSFRKILKMGMVKTGCGQSGDGTVKLTVSANEQME